MFTLSLRYTYNLKPIFKSIFWFSISGMRGIKRWNTWNRFVDCHHKGCFWDLDILYLDQRSTLNVHTLISHLSVLLLRRLRSTHCKKKRKRKYKWVFDQCHSCNLETAMRKFLLWSSSLMSCIITLNYWPFSGTTDPALTPGRLCTLTVSPVDQVNSGLSSWSKWRSRMRHYARELHLTLAFL